MEKAYQLLRQLVEIHAPSGEEEVMKDFILDYTKKHSQNWKVQPEIIAGPAFQDCILLVFGKPRTAVFAHMDSIGFTTRYENQLVPIGGPEAEAGYVLTGRDSKGPIECRILSVEDGQVLHDFPRGIDRGTSLVFKSDFRETAESIQSCYMDNRLGLLNALLLAETLENGIIAFTTYEEHGGGVVPILARYIFENYQVSQALVSDITWVTEGVHHGDGVAISMRDRGIPRKSYINKIVSLAQNSGIAFQLEVEGSGSSDARELQSSPYPYDWCFIGAPESNVHSPDELVYKYDFECMVAMYKYLMQHL